MKYKTKLNMKRTTASLVSASIIISTSLNNISIVNADDSIQVIDNISDNTSGSAIVIADKTNQEIQPLGAEIFGDGDFECTDVPGGKSINSFSHDGLVKLEANGYELNIPSTIDGVQVVNIGNNAFDNSFITSLTLPNSTDSVIEIGYKSFANNELTTLEIPSSIKTIGNYAFADNGLTSLTMLEGTTSIGERAFENNKLESVSISDSVTIIGDSAFEGDSENSEPTYKENVISKLKLGKGLKEIGENAFEYNKLTSVEIPDGVETIGSYAFISNQLKSVVIPDSVTSLGQGSFRKNQLESVYISKNLTAIASNTFAFNKLTKVEIPKGVTLINILAFAQNQLTDVTIPDTVTTLGISAFAFNELESIEIPNSVISIGNNVFNENKLTSIKIPDSVTSIGGNAFKNNQLTSVEIPNTVKTLGNGAFSRNYLKYIKFRDVETATVDVIKATWGTVVGEEDQLSGTDWSTSLPHTDDNFVDYADYSVNKQTSSEFYLRYPINITYELSNGEDEIAWKDLSFLTFDELKDKLSEFSITNEDGYDSIDWEIVNEDKLETLEIDGKTYIMGDVNVKPIYDKMTFEVTESKQLDLLTSNTDGSIYFKDTVKGTITPNEVFDFSLTEGYEFNLNGELKVAFENSSNTASLVKTTTFEDNVNYWQYMLNEEKTKILVKAPNVIEKNDEKLAVGVRIENVGIKDADGIFGDTTEKVVEVFLNKNDTIVDQGIIAKLEFLKEIVVEVVKPESVNGNRTDSSGSITVKSNVRYSIHDNELFVIKLAEGFRFINNTPDVDDPENQKEYIKITNTGSNADTIYVEKLADFDDGSTDWQYTYSDDFSTIYISTPIGLHAELTETRNVTDVDYAKGISFTISNLGVSTLNGDKLTVETPVNYTVTSDDGFIQNGLFATLKPETLPPTGGGGSGGGGGGHKPNKDKPTIEPEQDEILIDPYIFGYTDGSVRPNGNITRAEVAQVVYNIYGNNKAENKSILNNYSDINTNAWYSDAVAYATQAGVFEGYNDGTFKPNSPISREEVSAIIDRLYFDEIVSYGNLDIKLSDIQNSWAKEDIEYLVSKGIITGYPDGTFKPKQSIERDEFVVMMNKLTNRPKEYKVKTTFYDLSSNEWNYEDMMNASNYSIQKIIEE